MATSHKKKNEEGSSWEEDDMQILEGGQQRRLQKEEGGGKEVQISDAKESEISNSSRVESGRIESRSGGVGAF